MKVTIISLDKWGYNEFIASELKKRNIHVNHINFYTLRYKYPTFFHKIFNFFSKTIFDYNLKREHLNKVLLKALNEQEKQDAILIIKGDNLSINTLKEIKSHTSKMIAFLNDSTKRYPRMKKVYPFFDEIYSFDPSDVKKYNFIPISNYIYFDYHTQFNTSPQYDVFNISSLDKRSKTMPQFAAYFKERNLNYKLIAFGDAPDDNFEKLGIELTRKTYNLEDVFKLVTNSKILLDLQRPKQKGLSFRVFEALALNKKIISTNTDLKNYDFYNSNNIAIVDSNNIKIEDSFFTTPYTKIEESLVRKYHISSWVNTVFKLPEHES